MIDVSINNGVKSFGFGNILDSVSLDIMSGEKVAIIGDNGCGKSTLLKLIVGKEKFTEGVLSLRSKITFGYLEQLEDAKYKNIVVKDVLYESVKDITDMEIKLRLYEEKMSSVVGKDLDSLLNKYGNLQERYVNAGGYEVSEKVGRIITGFKIEKLLDKEFGVLSGGEKRIVSLAKVMINNPDLLLLDEPTNHLDVDTLVWLEKYLKNYDGTVVIVSHDRYFLDKVVDKIILLDRGQLEVFHGNYSYYIEENEKRALIEFEKYKNQQKQIEAMRATAKKLREWGKLGGNERFFKRAICIERRIEKIEMLTKPKDKKDLPLSFELDQRSSKDVVVVDKINLNIEDKSLLKNASMIIKYEDRICLLGENGCGKSTLIREILSNNNPSIKLGNNIKIGYIPQVIEFEDENMSVLEVARSFFIGEDSHLRSALVKFLFYNEDVFKKVKVLSGGEKIRLKLFELIQRRANFLVFDEPTNHIDIGTKEMLEEALLEFKGTILFVSHDRYFINKMASKIYVFNDYKLNLFLGNYEEYLKSYK